MANLQVSPLGGSRDETWRGQGIKRCSVSWNLPKLCQLWRCNGGFGPSTTQNHLRTKQFVNGTRNSSRLAVYALRRLSSVCEKLLSEALRSQHIAQAGNCRCLSQVSGAFCANVFARKDTGAAAVAGTEFPGSHSSFLVLRGFPTAARGRGVCWEAGFQWRGDIHACGKVNRHKVRIWGTENPMQLWNTSVIDLKWMCFLPFSPCFATTAQ
jgi:hypothetical protein